MTARGPSLPGPFPRASAQTRVLVVDDDPLIRAILEELLQSSGYWVATADSGAEALALAQELTFDVVLLDVRMPGECINSARGACGDGIDACAQLRALPGGDRTAIVLMSATRSGELRLRAAHSGADDFLPKPLDSTETLLRVRSLVRLKRLRDDLDARTGQVRAQSTALLKAQEERRQLNAMIVHDLKGPLSVLLANVRYALGEASLSVDAREGLEEVVQSGTQMHRMILDLLDTDRAEDGRLTPRFSTSTADEVLEVPARAARVRARETGHELSLEATDGALAVHADQDLLRRVLENLLDNAFKYSPKGTRIELGLRPAGNSVELWVADQGPGIPPAAKDAVFERYVRLDRDAQNSEHSSRGLGLAFCRVAVEAMGGTIHIEDQAPRGARFVVRLKGHSDA